MFCGIGGIDLAFEKARHTVVWANDIDKYACMTYRHNSPDIPLVEGDIRDIDKASIPAFDVLVAGFPCQPFSVCGKQNGFSDPRGNVFFEIGKIVDAKHPSVVFLENVANLTEQEKHSMSFITNLRGEDIIFAILSQMLVITECRNIEHERISSLLPTKPPANDLCSLRKYLLSNALRI